VSGRILIVNDVATNRIVLKGQLTAACYRTLQAASGRAALRIAERETPDLILLDLELPDIDGIAVCRQLRANPATRMIPIVMLTVRNDPAARLGALAAGVDDFLPRPVDDQLLRARLRNLLRAREMEAELSLREMTGRELGFAEDTPAFEGPALIALVAAQPADAVAWRAAMAPRIAHRMIVLDRAEAVFEMPEAPDAVVIAADLARPGDGLRLMSDLRSRPETRHAAMCVVLPAGQAELAAIALDLGAADVVSAPFDPRELALRLDSMVYRKRLRDRLRARLRDGMRQAVRDPLTGLHNRRYALPHLGRVADRAAQTGSPFAVLVLDLDRFKAVNDRWGHPSGDAVLVEVARRLQDNLRAVDLLARIGGEEFLAVLPDTQLGEAQAVAERLCRVVEERTVALPAGGAIPVTLSIGLAIGGGGRPVAQVLDLADQALLRAKSDGRNQVTVHQMTAA
jgi:two-component system cell cycle response regulator